MTSVKEQYETLPYPPRAPQMEEKLLMVSPIDFLDQVNYYGFEGRQNFKNFRVLVAGGGTGDGSIFLAEQLRAHDAEIIHLDLSSASIDVAKARAERRGLKNIRFIQASLLDAPTLGLGEFDYIESLGVLHHVPDPAAGLHALRDVLKPTGAMGLLVYAQYGREGLYQMQNLLKLLNHKTPDVPGKLANARKAIAAITPQHHYQTARALVGDESMGDAGLYDMLLHSVDRAYTVPQIYEWVENAGMHVRAFVGKDAQTKLAYRPDVYVKDAALLGEIGKLSLREQLAVGELLSGQMVLHSFYVSKKHALLPSLLDPEMVPFFGMVVNDAKAYSDLHQAMNGAVGSYAGFTRQGVTMSLPVHALSSHMAPHINGVNTTAEICGLTMRAIKAEGRDAPDLKTLLGVLNATLAPLMACDWMFLRHKDALADYPTAGQLQAAFEHSKAS